MIPADNTDVRAEIERLGDWYHRIDLGNGVVTPGDRNQSLTFALYADQLPNLQGVSVLDVGANACGFSIELARRGAQVTAVEIEDRFVAQAQFVTKTLGLQDCITIRQGDALEIAGLGTFDLVVCFGVIYHVRHPQLLLDQLAWVTRSALLFSTQTSPGNTMSLLNRGNKVGEFWRGWDPTEPAIDGMLKLSGFQDVKLVSVKPHPGESAGNICGNRCYYLATADAERRPPLPKYFAE